MTIAQVLQHTKSLSPSDKAKLVDLILLDLDRAGLVVEKAWVKEIVRRRKSLRSGKTRPLSYQQVMGKYTGKSSSPQKPPPYCPRGVSVLALKGSGTGLWGADPTRTVAEIRDKWA